MDSTSRFANGVAAGFRVNWLHAQKLRATRAAIRERAASALATTIAQTLDSSLSRILRRIANPVEAFNLKLDRYSPQK